ncbi:MAG: N-6 DNA methylase [Anaerolineales bacterium]|nr:N-6 DNA methylase [Anaerolineales bacterium]
MTTQELAYTEVEKLVKGFRSLSAPQRKGMNEMQTRLGYILPLFKALGWDTSNINEVSPEEKVSRGWVDFSFRIGNVPRYFLETKRANEDLNDPRWVKQAIDYAWTKSVTWALLSDFEGLRVFNAEWKESNPFSAQFIEFGLDDYLKDFERLWWLSKPETNARRLDLEAEKVGKKVKRLPVSQHLFDDLKKWRENLFKNYKAFNPIIPAAEIDTAVLRLLNRLIFIRTAEDRQVEDNRLRSLVRELRDKKQINHLDRELAELFRQFDAIYDSELFARHFSEELQIPPSDLEEVIEGLYEKNYVRYNFNALDADVLGTAYEQYLGHVVAEGETETHVEEKRTKRKSQGIYYTPTFVTKYIVQQTVGRYLNEHGYNPSQPLRVLDMACGSGSFLIEAFDIIDDFVAKQRGHAQKGEVDFYDRLRQLEVLQNCIFGVDKDKQAVEVARLNLLLRGLHSREKLPMLGNIAHGNSLHSETFEMNFSQIMKEGGFDVIVGNPPYGAKFTDEEKSFLKEHYEYKSGKPDSYIYFMELAVKLLRENGILGLIIPNAWLTNYYGHQLRRYLLNSCEILVAVNLEPVEVFADAIVDTTILIARKQGNELKRRNNQISICESTAEGEIEFKHYTSQSEWLDDSKFIFNLLSGSATTTLSTKIESVSTDLSKICIYSQGIIPYKTKQDSENNPYIADKPISPEWKPLLDSGDCVNRYVLTWHHKHIRYGTWLTRRRDSKFFERPKILFQRIRKKLPTQLIATYDDTGYYNRHSLSNIILQDGVNYDLKYLLGLFNSKLINYWFVNRFGLLMEVGGFKVGQIPIRHIDFGNPAEKSAHDEIVKLVEKMLALQKERQSVRREDDLDRVRNLEKQIAQVDAEIDQRVYALYGLTEEEIKIVEGV